MVSYVLHIVWYDICRRSQSPFLDHMFRVRYNRTPSHGKMLPFLRIAFGLGTYVMWHMSLMWHRFCNSNVGVAYNGESLIFNLQLVLPLEFLRLLDSLVKSSQKWCVRDHSALCSKAGWIGPYRFLGLCFGLYIANIDKYGASSSSLDHSTFMYFPRFIYPIPNLLRFMYKSPVTPTLELLIRIGTEIIFDGGSMYRLTRYGIQVLSRLGIFAIFTSMWKNAKIHRWSSTMRVICPAHLLLC